MTHFSVLKKSLFLLILGLAVTIPAHASTAPAVADTFTLSASPTLNFGTLANLNVGGGAASHLQFSMSGLPTGITSANVGKAVLTVYVNKINVAGSLDVRQITSPWTENTLTFNNAPLLGVNVATAVPVGSTGYVQVDVTGLVKIWVDTPTLNYGVAVLASTAQPTTSLLLDSKESTLTSHAADISIDLISQGPQGAQGATGSQGQPGPQGQQGPQGVQGSPTIISVGTRRTVTVIPTVSLAFLSPPLSITVTSSTQPILVSAQVLLGTAESSASGLRLWICYQANGGSIVTVHPNDWIAPLAVSGSLNDYSLSDVVTGLAAGNYSVGMCGTASAPSNWDKSDWSYTTAQVMVAGTQVLN